MARILVVACLTLCLVASTSAVLPLTPKPVQGLPKRPLPKRAPAAKGPACPTPLQMCDLFYGQPTVPTFKVVADKGNRILSTAPVYTKTGSTIQTLGIYGCRFYQGAGAGCKGFGFFPLNPFTNITNVLGTYPMLPGVARNLQNRCVILSIDNFYVAGVGWINYGDNNPRFPANRRCIVIHT